MSFKVKSLTAPADQHSLLSRNRAVFRCPVKLDTVQFGHQIEGQVSPPVQKDGKIDTDIYKVLRHAYKFESHVHQSGSSDIHFLKYALFKAIMDGDVALAEKTNPETGEKSLVEWIEPTSGESANSDLRKLELGELLKDTRIDDFHHFMDIDNIRHFYRVAVQQDRGKYFRPDAELEEDVLPEELEQLRQKIKEQGLDNYRKTSKRINFLVKNIPASYLLANMFAQSIANENVRYAEYRVSPVAEKFSDEEFSIQELFHWVNEGFSDAKGMMEKSYRNFDYGLILLLERDTPESAKNMVQEAIRLRDKYPIVGIDVAGDELNYPVTAFKEAFDLVKEYNDNPLTPQSKRIGITIHAGETPRSGKLKGYESIQEAIDLAWSPNTPVRIGHGIQIVNSSPALKAAYEEFLVTPDKRDFQPNKEEIAALIQDCSVVDSRGRERNLLREVIDKNIILEACPKSNVQTSAIAYHDKHPAVFLSRLGVNVSVSTDNRTISNSDNTNEFVKLFKHSGLTYDDFKRMALRSIEGAFIFDPVLKSRVKAEIAERFKEMEASEDFVMGIHKMNDPDYDLSPTEAFLAKMKASVLRLKITIEGMLEHIVDWLNETVFKAVQAS